MTNYEWGQNERIGDGSKRASERTALSKWREKL